MLEPIDVLRSYPSFDGTLHGMLESRAAINGERTFLIFDDCEMSWNSAVDEVRRVADRLIQMGVAAGDRIALMARNSDRYVILYFAIG